MRYKSLFVFGFLSLLLACPWAWGDEILLKSGRQYSGKFIRGDSTTVDFRILDRIESFKTSEVAQIVFKEPELAIPAADRRLSSSPTPEQPPTRSQSTPIGREMSTPPARSQGASATSLPAGTPLTVRTATAIDPDRNRVGDSFDATLDEPVTSGDLMIFPRGSLVRGRIAIAKESGRISGQSQLVLELTEIDANGKRYSLLTTDYTEVGSSRGRRTTATVGGTAALGAIIGAIAGGGKGAAVGAASGAAVGTGAQILTRGEILKIPAETVLEFHLQSPLNLDVP